MGKKGPHLSAHKFLLLEVCVDLFEDMKEKVYEPVVVELAYGGVQFLYVAQFENVSGFYVERGEYIVQTLHRF